MDFHNVYKIPVDDRISEWYNMTAKWSVCRAVRLVSQPVRKNYGNRLPMRRTSEFVFGICARDHTERKVKEFENQMGCPVDTVCTYDFDDRLSTKG